MITAQSIERDDDGLLRLRWVEDGEVHLMLRMGHGSEATVLEAILPESDSSLEAQCWEVLRQRMVQPVGTVVWSGADA